MIIDGAFILHLSKELNSSLENSRLEKVFQIKEDAFIFQFYYQRKKHKLMIDLSPNHFSAYLTKKNTHTQLNTQFSASLKKQLEGGILKKVRQYKTDRVIIFDFVVYDFIDGPISKSLIFEAMGKHSNLLLIQNDIIIDTYKKMFFESGRQLIPGATFEFFPSDKEMFTNIDFALMEHPKMISQTYMGVGLKLATFLFDHNIQIEKISVKPTKDLSKNTGYWTDIFSNQHEKKYFSSLSELLDDHQEIKAQYKQSYELFIDKQIKKLLHKKDQLEQSLSLSYKKLEDKEIADSIYQSGEDLYGKMTSIQVLDKDVSLDATITLNDNAQNFYKSYQKAKRSIDHINKQINETQSLIELFESFSLYVDISTESDLSDLENDLVPYGYKAKKQKQTKKQRQKPNIIKLIDQDATYLIGKNDLQNAYVTHELAQSNDYFFHVKDAPGSHLIVKSDFLNESIIRKAAMLAAYFSSLRFSSSIPVDYTLIKYVKKIPKTPGFKVLLKNQKTIFIDIDEDLIKSYL